jgi:hypothetical protein
MAAVAPGGDRKPAQADDQRQPRNNQPQPNTARRVPYPDGVLCPCGTGTPRSSPSARTRAAGNYSYLSAIMGSRAAARMAG